MWERLSIQSGMRVRSAGGKRLGRVSSCGERHFLVVAPFRRRRFCVAYEDVKSLSRGEVRLSRQRFADVGVLGAEGPLTFTKPLKG
ncbi:MAG: hypothetical protein ACOZIN_19340 [Myxococcota bacterium]